MRIVDNLLTRFIEKYSPEPQPSQVIDTVAMADEEVKMAEEATLPKPELDEISSSKSAIYAEYDITPYNPDTLVGRKGIAIYDSLRLDDQVKAVLSTKKVARLSTPWKIVPYSNSEQDRMIADFIQWNFHQMNGTIESDLFEIMSALDYGFSITEIVWKIIENKRYKGKIGLKALKTRKPHNFELKTDGFDNLEYILQKAATENKKLDPGKFIVYSYQKEFDNWYGTSDLRAVYRNIFSKDVLIKFWNIWLERFPSPIILGFYPQGTPKTVRDNLLNMLKRVQIATAAVIPDNLEVDIKENASTGHDVFLQAIEFHNKSISRGILVPDLIGFTETTGPGSYALGKKHFDVFLLILDRLGKEIEEPILLEQLIKRMVDYNWRVEGYPEFKWDTLSEENVEAKAKILTMLVAAKLIDPSEEWVRSYLGLPSSSPFITKPPEKKPDTDVDNGDEDEDDVEDVDIDKINDTRVGAGEKRKLRKTSVDPNELAEPPVSKCMDCSSPPTFEVLWAEGMGHAWFCTNHLKRFVKKHVKEAAEEGWGLAIDSIKETNDGKASQRFKNNPNSNILDAILKSLKRSQQEYREEEVTLFQELRSLTIYEERAGFDPRKLEETMEDWVEISSTSIAGSVSELISSVVKQVKAKKILNLKPREAYRAMQEVTINPRTIRVEALNSLMYAFFLGKEAGFDEVQTALGKKIKLEEVGGVEAFTAAFATGSNDFTKVLPTKALERFAKKIPTPILKRDIGKIVQREKNKAFTIAGVIEKDTIGNVQDLLIKSIEGGWDLEQFEHQVRQRAIEYTGTAYGRERTGEPIKAYHLDTILRTQFNDIYNRGRKELYDDPDVVAYVPAFQFSAILDEVTRANHAAMDGNVYPRGDPIWKIWWPPIDFNCRCTVIPVTENQDWSTSPRPGPGVTPAPGFGGLEEEEGATKKREKVPVAPPTRTPDEQAQDAREEIIRMSAEKSARSAEIGAEIKSAKADMWAAKKRGDKAEMDKHSNRVIDLREKQRKESKAANEAIKVKLQANPKGTKMEINMASGEISRVQNAVKGGVEDYGKYVDPKVMTQKHVYAYGTSEPRSYASRGSIHISVKRGDRKTVIHEMGHHLEQTSPEVRRKARQFLTDRTRGEQATWLGDGYRRNERAYKDRFLHPYMGKRYPQDTEIISMGLQFYHSQPLTLAKKDPGYFDFMWKTLRGM